MGVHRKINDVELVFLKNSIIFEGQFQFLVSPPSHDASADSVGVFVGLNLRKPYLLHLPKHIILYTCQRYY
ncbi:MAG: hypothetical protein ACI9UR_000407 [Bacteroidia bacterium]|jgi:hypothetical protein